MTLLEIRDLRVSYGQVDVVRGIDLSVDAGESVALVGESGSGKSVTARSILRLLDAGGAIRTGSISFAGKDIVALPEREVQALRGDRIAMVFQEPMTSLNPVMTVGRQVGEVLALHRGLGRAATRSRTVELLEATGIPGSVGRRFPHQLSGGMRQRVMIAAALACAPDLLIADEPTTALDATVGKQILDLIADQCAQLGTALLLITHDLGIVADRTSRIAVMREGRVVETGPTGQVLRAPQHAYTRQLLAALAPKPVAASTPGEPLLVVDGLRKRFAGSTRGWRARQHVQAVDGVSLRIGAGETLGLVGESGSGKSTVGRLILRLVDPDGGTIHFDGADVTRLRGRALRAMRGRIAMIFQDPYGSLDPRMTVAAQLAGPLVAHGWGDARARAGRVVELLEIVGLSPDHGGRFPHQLSGGQRQRVAIARALAVQPKLVVCDEPVSALDVSIQAQILELLVDLQRRYGLAYLFISHDLRVVRQISNRIAVMRDGRVVETGATEEVFAAPAHPFTRELLASIPGAELAR